MEKFSEIISMLSIIVLGIYIASIDIRFANKQKDDAFRFIKLIYATVGILWTGLYTSFLINPVWQVSTSARYTVRGLIIFTLIALAMGSTARAYSARLFKGKDLSI